MTDTYTPVLTDAEIFNCFDDQCSEIVFHFDADELYPVGRAIERAAIEAYQRRQTAGDAHFDLWQDDMVVASACGPRDKAMAEIQHYAVQYAQDGPVQIEEVIRIPVSAPSESA